MQTYVEQLTTVTNEKDAALEQLSTATSEKDAACNALAEAQKELDALRTDRESKGEELKKRESDFADTAQALKDAHERAKCLEEDNLQKACATGSQITALTADKDELSKKLQAALTERAGDESPLPPNTPKDLSALADLVSSTLVSVSLQPWMIVSVS